MKKWRYRILIALGVLIAFGCADQMRRWLCLRAEMTAFNSVIGLPEKVPLFARPAVYYRVHFTCTLRPAMSRKEVRAYMAAIGAQLPPDRPSSPFRLRADRFVVHFTGAIPGDPTMHDLCVWVNYDDSGFVRSISTDNS